MMQIGTSLPVAVEASLSTGLQCSRVAVLIDVPAPYTRRDWIGAAIAFRTRARCLDHAPAGYSSARDHVSGARSITHRITR